MIRSSEAIEAISAALVAAQSELEAVDRNATNPAYGGRSYASLDALVSTSRPVLARHGLAVVQMPWWDGEVDYLVTRVIHSSGQWIEAAMRLYLAKYDAQSQAAAITYGRRHAYSAALGIVTEDENPRATQAPRQTRRAPSAGGSDGACSVCGGTKVHITASGREMPCPKCSSGDG